MLCRLITWLRNRRNFVILDARDNSVTFSRRLFRRIKDVYGGSDIQSPKVFVFYVPATKCYGFAIDVPIKQPVQLADIQYNAKYKCIGFETLCPTVAKILYDYNVTHPMIPCRLTATIRTTPSGHVYYQIERPPKNALGRKH